MQCRVCMQSKCHILFEMNILGTKDGKNLYECFNECTQPEASADDGLPKTLCKICAQKLQVAYNFRRTAKQSNEELKKLLISVKKKTDSVDSTPEEFCALEDMGDSTDPLNMSFHEAVRALQESLVKSPKSSNRSLEEGLVEPLVVRALQESLVKSPKTSNRSLEEGLVEPLVVFTKENICLEKSAESPNRSLEEKLVEPLVVFTKETNCLEKSSESSSKFFEEALQEPLLELQKETIYLEKSSKSPSKFFEETLQESLQKLPKGTICLEKSSISPNRSFEEALQEPLLEFSKETIYLEKSSKSPNRSFEVTLEEYLQKLPKRTICLEKSSKSQNRLIEETLIEIVREVAPATITELQDTSLQTKDKQTNVVTTNDSVNNCTGNLFRSLVVDEGEDKPIECKPCQKSNTRLGSYNNHKITETTDINDMEKTMENEIVDILDIEASIAKTESEQSPSLADLAWEAESNIVQSQENNLESEQNNVVDQVPKESVKKQQKERKNISQLKEKRRYLCSFCPRVLCSNVSLRTHEKTQHLGGKKDIMKECPICRKKMYMDYIKKHIRMVHIGERNNVCDICGGRYKTFNTLQRHKLLHMADRQWQCSACDMKFVDKYALNIHMRLHTGEKPFACHLCDRRFRIGSHLTYHLERHANIKKKCNVCGKEFTSGTTLRKHSFLHTGDMPYKCTDCDYETAKREYFISHMLRKHDRKMTEDELFLMFKRNTGKTTRVKNFECLNKLFENSEKSDHSN